MKTTLDLLIRLAELENAKAKRTVRGEKLTVLLLKRLVRDSLPEEVLPYHDMMLDQESELLPCPQVFAMAVLVAAYKGLNRRRRQKLLSHFESTVPVSQGLEKRRSSSRKQNFAHKRCRALAA